MVAATSCSKRLMLCLQSVRNVLCKCEPGAMYCMAADRVIHDTICPAKGMCDRMQHLTRCMATLVRLSRFVV
jgi:hypothetical protein